MATLRKEEASTRLELALGVAVVVLVVLSFPAAWYAYDWFTDGPEIREIAQRQAAEMVRRQPPPPSAPNDRSQAQRPPASIKQVTYTLAPDWN
jgi:hypothetical protein